ncbi:MAG: hypothetical protein ABW204_01060 [Microbacteriaceae bacterium]
MTRRILAAALTAAAVLGGLLVASPASATTTRQLELSTDGRTWSSSIPGTLFDALPVIVPGDSVSRTLYVRNAGATAGLLRLDAVDVRISNADFAESLRVGATIEAASLGSTDLGGSSDCITVLPSGRIAAGAVATVEITLGFDENAPMPTQDSTADFSLLLSVSEDIGQTAPSAGCPDEGIELPTLPFPEGEGGAGTGDPGAGGSASAPPSAQPAATSGSGLALTGATVLPLLATSGGLLLLGIAVLTATRRRKHAE